MTLKVMGKVKSKVTIGLPEKNPTTLVEVIFLCDTYFSNYPVVPELLTHPVLIHFFPPFGIRCTFLFFKMMPVISLSLEA